MYKIETYVEPHYPVKRSYFSDIVQKTLGSNRIKGGVKLTISVIGDRKMRYLNKQFRDIDSTTDVLAFPYTLETGTKQFIDSSGDKYLNLGEVVISYPQLLNRAAKEETLVDEMLAILTIHGVLHLIGRNHKTAEDTLLMESMEDQILSSIRS